MSGRSSSRRHHEHGGGRLDDLQTERQRQPGGGAGEVQPVGLRARRCGGCGACGGECDGHQRTFPWTVDASEQIVTAQFGVFGVPLVGVRRASGEDLHRQGATAGLLVVIAVPSSGRAWPPPDADRGSRPAARPRRAAGAHPPRTAVVRRRRGLRQHRAGAPPRRRPLPDGVGQQAPRHLLAGGRPHHRRGVGAAHPDRALHAGGRRHPPGVGHRTPAGVTARRSPGRAARRGPRLGPEPHRRPAQRGDRR